MKKIVFSVVFFTALLFSLSSVHQTASASDGGENSRYLTESAIVYINGGWYIKIICTSIRSWHCDSPGSVWYIPTDGMTPW